jgi:non-specific serine/threonine protein kinase
LYYFWFVRAHPSEGRSWLERALALGGDAPATFRAKALSAAGRLAVEQGDPRRAEALIGQSLALWRGLGDLEQVAINLIGLGRALATQERFAEAAVQTAEAYELYEDLTDAAVWAAPLASVALSNLGAFAIAQGEYARAADYLTEALTRQRALGYSWGAGNTLIHSGRLALARGDMVKAAGYYREGLNHARAHDDLWIAARALVGMAAIALTWGQPERAAPLLGAAAALDEARGTSIRPSERADQDRMRGAIRAALGEAGFAAAWESGRALASDSAAIDALLPADPSTLAPLPEMALPAAVPSAAAYGLSKREREVLALLAQRYTDPEIAECLSIAPSTVSTHVKHIFVKLGAANRRDAAALAARRGLV